MSMNQYMHPRNIYKQPPNFKQLAIEYPEFRQYVSQDLTGKVSIDFKNTEALRALTCTLLKKDFGLNVEIPLNKLIPTVPLRLNYILWIEDLLNLTGKKTNIIGIDIGTGASCIYPILIAKLHQWKMIATEIDEESIEYALKNIKNNSLDSLIKVIHVKGDALLQGVVPDEDYDFCMCNPPFFATTQELHPFFKARNPSRPHPRNAFCASVDEVVSKGGEVEYVSKLIQESKHLGLKVKIYTTMIGHKVSLPPLKKLLREIDVVSFKQTEFCQGHTTRWGLAWTFHDIDLRKIPESLIEAKQKLPKPLLYEIPNNKEDEYKMNLINEKLVKIFQQLEIEYQQVKHIKNLIEYIIIAESNTWSNQRRKRREKMRLENPLELNGDDSNQSGASSDSGDLKKTVKKFAEMDFRILPSQKRALEDDDSGFYNSKRIKTDQDDVSKVYLKAIVSLIKVDSVIGLELVFVEGVGTKEALHQVLQYIKNNLQK